MSAQHTPEQADHDLKQYGRALRTGSTMSAIAIEKRWELYGYPPEIVSNVLSCVATGLPLSAALDEVLGSDDE